MADAHPAAARQFRPNRIEVHRGPYEYSVPGHDKDFTPQNEPEKHSEALTHGYSLHSSSRARIRACTTRRSASGCSWRPKSCSSARSSPPTSCCASARTMRTWPHGLLNIPIGTFNTAVLITSSVTVVLAWAALKMGNFKKFHDLSGSHHPLRARLPRHQVVRIQRQVHPLRSLEERWHAPHRPHRRHTVVLGDEDPAGKGN